MERGIHMLLDFRWTRPEVSSPDDDNMCGKTRMGQTGDTSSTSRSSRVKGNQVFSTTSWRSEDGGRTRCHSKGRREKAGRDATTAPCTWFVFLVNASFSPPYYDMSPLFLKPPTPPLVAKSLDVRHGNMYCCPVSRAIA